MKIAVCEDNSLERELLCDLLRNRAAHLGIPCEIFGCAKGETLIEALESGMACDYLILDIFLEGKSGISTAMKARAIRPDIHMAFLTASRDYAPEAFLMNALHYLIKPVTLQTAEELLRRYQERTGLEVDIVVLKAGSAMYELPVKRIEKVVSSQKKCVVYLQGAAEPLRVPISFSAAEEQLQSDNLLRITRGMLVNMDYIVEMRAAECRLKDGTIVLLSRNNRSELRNRYRNYCSLRQRNPSAYALARSDC